MATNRHFPGVGKVSRLQMAGDAFGIDNNDVRSGDFVRACEVCGTERPSSDMMNYACVIGSPGHYRLPPFQHPEIEHWACSLDCWKELYRRVGEDMVELLIGKHVEKRESVHHEDAKAKAAKSNNAQ
jgi:hypothetical protein